MRTYNIILSDIPNIECDAKFGEYVNKNKLDFWRYTSLNWILLTPDNISTNMLIGEVVNAYGAIFFCVLEIQINDAGGILPGNEEMVKEIEKTKWTPFQWFNHIKDPKFVPRWIKESSKKE